MKCDDSGGFGGGKFSTWRGCGLAGASPQCPGRRRGIPGHPRHRFARRTAETGTTQREPDDARPTADREGDASGDLEGEIWVLRECAILPRLGKILPPVAGGGQSVAT